MQGFRRLFSLCMIVQGFKVQPLMTKMFHGTSLMINVKAQLDSMKELNKRVVLLTQTFASPSNELIIKKFLKKFSNIEHVSL